MIGRALRAVPGAAWACLPGLAILAWWQLHEPATAPLRAELDRLQARIAELAEHHEAVEELPRLRREITINVELIRRLKSQVSPLHPSLKQLFRMLPRDLAIERLVVEGPAWRVQLDLLETDRGRLQGLTERLAKEPSVERTHLVKRSDGALSLVLVPTTPSEWAP